MAKFHGTIFYEFDPRGTRHEIGKVVSVLRAKAETDDAFAQRVNAEAAKLVDAQSTIVIEEDHRDGRANQVRIIQQPKTKRRPKQKMTA